MTRYKPVYDRLSQMREIALIAHNMRSSHNVGSLLRTAEGFGIQSVYLTGYTPYPETQGDNRLPHIRKKLTTQISKTALGAEKTDIWQHHPNVETLIENLRDAGFKIFGLEQSSHSVLLPSVRFPQKSALILGSEVDGISSELLELCDEIIEITMYGTKESFNVVQAAAVAMYALRET